MYIFVLFSSSLVFFLCCFLGLLLFKLLKLKSDTLDIHISNSFWVGYSIFIALLLSINIFLPINIISTMPIFIILTTISIILNQKLIKYLKSNISVKYIACFVGLNILAFIYLRSNTYDGGYSFDTYNYHFYILRLTNEYPAIKGIVNLFPHLSNMYSTIYHASFIKVFSPQYFFDNYLFFISVHTIFTAILVTVILTFKKHVTENKYSKNRHSTFYNDFTIISSFILLAYPLSMPGAWDGSEKLLGHFPDIAYYLISYVFILFFCKFLTEVNKINLFMLVFIAASVVFVKASSLFLVFTTLCVSSFVWFKQNKKNGRTYFLYIFLVAILIMPYILQHTIKSGALVFPVSFTDMGLIWSNKVALKEYTAGALSWARSNHIDPRGREIAYMGWIKFWINAYSKFLLYHAVTYIILLGSLIIIFLKANLFYERTVKNILMFFIVWMPSMLFWFLTAPDVRFVGILFLVPVFVMLTLIYTYFGKIESIHISVKHEKIILIVALGLLLIKGGSEYHKILSLNRPIPNTDDTFIKEDYDGVDIYIGAWDVNKYCSYTTLLPCSLQRNYKFIDPKMWYEGFIPKE